MVHGLYIVGDVILVGHAYCLVQQEDIGKRNILLGLSKGSEFLAYTFAFTITIAKHSQ